MDIGELIQVIQRDTGLTVMSHNLLLDGWDNLVFEVNHELIFRFTRRGEILQQHLKELELLPLLNQTLSLMVPNPVCRQTETSPYYMAYKKIPGKPITSSYNKEKLTETITRFLHELQNTDPTELKRTPRYTPETWRKEYLELHRRIISEVYPLLEPGIQARISQTFKEFLATEFTFNSVLCHRDLSTDHILESEGVITGIIDWGDACIGDPAFDLTGLLMGYGEGVAVKISGNLGYPEEYLDRARFYGKIASFYEALYGIELNDENHIKAGLKKINKIYG